jgi:hypothetical protein
LLQQNQIPETIFIFFVFKGKSLKLGNITHFVTYQCVKEGCLFVLFDCHIEITQITSPLAMLLIHWKALDE